MFACCFLTDFYKSSVHNKSYIQWKIILFCLKNLFQVLCNILITSVKKRDKVSIATTSSNFIFLNFLSLPQGSISCPLYFAIYINNLSNHIAVPYPRVSLDTPVLCKGLICLYFVILSVSQYFVIHLNRLE